jgi:hypothetical protein
MFLRRGLGGRVGESHMVHDAHLFILQMNTTALELAGEGRNGVMLLSGWHSIRRFSTVKGPECHRDHF